MKLEEGQLRFKATDLSDYSACRHKTVLERSAARGELKRPGRADPAMQLLQERGIEHEQRYLEVLEQRHGEKAFRVSGAAPITGAAWRSATVGSLDAMRAGYRIIYQAPLSHGPWTGFADFLLRRDHAPGAEECFLGDYHYEVVDTKLALEAKGSAILQLCVYSEAVGVLQGRTPEAFHIASPASSATGQTAGSNEKPFPTADFAAYFRLIRSRFERFAREENEGPAPYPEPVEHCGVCAWWESCDKKRRADDHLSLVAGIGSGHRRLLEDSGIGTLTRLGELSPNSYERPRMLPLDSFNRLRHQAQLQLEARTAPPRFEILTVEPERGLCRLPEPDDGDVFFDIEADRYAPGGTFHYLLGWVMLASEQRPEYRHFWSSTRFEERTQFEQLVDFLVERRRRFPRMHVYHFAPFEKTALGEMSLRYLSREAEVDALLRDQVLVDLMGVVKQGLRAGVESYSIKELEQFYEYERQTDLRKASRARRLFELHRLDGAAAELPGVVRTITDYNREDCESTYFLQKFLESQRQHLVDRGEDVPRPVPPEPTDPGKKNDWERRLEKLRARLLDPIPDDLISLPSNEQDGFRARQLLADLLDWHWRETKPDMWKYFRECELGPEQLLEDTSPLGNVADEEHIGKDPASGRKVHLYRYPFPSQEYSIREGDSVVSPLRLNQDGKPQKFGTVASIDRERNTITLERLPEELGAPLALIKNLDMPPIKSLQLALAEMAESLAADFGLPKIIERQDDWGAAFVDSAPSFRAARALLARERPRVSGEEHLKHPHEFAGDALRRVAPLLDGTVLPVQGPPGSGKSHCGSRMILELVRQGRTVGICAQSHKVIENLLSKVFEAVREANEQGDSIEVFSVQKPKTGSPGLQHPNNRVVTKNEQVAPLLKKKQVDIVAGTCWLFANSALRSLLNVLVIDEAGQFSLADALAASVSADSLVLLGDPQQLPQVTQANHPQGAEASVLGHLLGEHDVVPEGRGLFLERTWRLPPNIASFTSEYYYAGQLRAHPDCGRRKLDAGGAAARFSGEGLWFEEVAHSGNVNYSPEEADRIREIVQELLADSSESTWTDRDGNQHRLLPAQVLVVAPYNSQVNLVRQALDAVSLEKVKVGTVDKFQGQEAPVVIYSMTTSRPEDAPRGFDFLFSANRFNVATSRSQAICIIVGSPRLLEADCKTPKQMRLVNGLCGAVEVARQGGVS